MGKATGNKEIERRFLLNRLPNDIIGMSEDARWYMTAYLHTENPEVRIRRWLRVCPARGEASFSMAVKFGDGIERYEFLYDVPKELFDKESIGKPMILKTRFRVKERKGVIWELDSFEGALRGLYVAEIELKKADQKVEFPSWLAPHVQKEVTGDPRYYNKNLVSNGLPDPR